MAFGAGAHQCLGLHLARLQIRILFDALLDRVDEVKLAGEPSRSSSTFVGGLKTLPLRVSALRLHSTIQQFFCHSSYFCTDIISFESYG